MALSLFATSSLAWRTSMRRSCLFSLQKNSSIIHSGNFARPHSEAIASFSSIDSSTPTSSSTDPGVVDEVKKEPPRDKSAKKKDSLTTDALVRAVAATHDLTLAEARRILTTVFDKIAESLVDKKRVSVSSFGTFETYMAKGRMARNPRTGDPILIPERDRIRFKPYTDLKRAITGEPKSTTPV